MKILLVWMDPKETKQQEEDMKASSIESPILQGLRSQSTTLK